MQAATSVNGKFATFEKPGDEITLKVTDYTERPSTYKGQPRRNQRGEQVMEAVIEGLDLNATSKEEAAKVITAHQWRLQRAIGKAVADAGASDIQKGGTLRVVFTDYDAGQGQNPAKGFEAEYWLPEPEGEMGEDE